VFRFLKKKPTTPTSSTIQLSLVTLCEDGYCAVVGESHYQDALRATSRVCAVGPEGRPTFTAALVPEPDNPYDSNAIAVYSPQGTLGHFSRDSAVVYRQLFGEVIRLGYHGGACEAYLTGGAVDKPSFGVVLHLADAGSCLAELRGVSTEHYDLEESAQRGRSNPGFVRSRHYTSYVDDVKELRRAGHEEEAERLLLELVEATEAENEIERLGVAPWYYEQLAISYRKRGDIRSEVQILERFARQKHAPGVMPPALLNRLEKARALEQRG
jgi:hypothetical protein